MNEALATLYADWGTALLLISVLLFSLGLIRKML